jgi:cytochrome c-type biogenesis protein CcmH/NrfF
MIARLLGVVLTLLPVGLVVALFGYWLERRRRRDLLQETTTKEKRK